MDIWSRIETEIENATGEPFTIGSRSSVGGGSINEALVVSDDKRKFFVKLNSVRFNDMFSAECDGLNEIVASKSVKAPQPVATGKDQSQCFIILEHLNFGANSNNADATLGEQLAKMHHHTQS